MNARRELNIKPTCANEMQGFPSELSGQLWEKIAWLAENPIPDGKLKKKLKAKGDLYRLRVGQYRLFYTFGDTWIRLLSLRKRDSGTYGKKAGSLHADEPHALPPPGEEPDVEAADLEESEPAPKTFSFSVAEPSPAITRTPLPQPLTPEWLRQLKVPESTIPTLVLCTSEEELLAAAVPQGVLERVVDNLFPKPLEEVLAQPDLVVQSTEDLVRFKEGSLLSFLLRLDADQAKLTTWALKGPTLVRGGAGTGKSTVALYRVRELLRRKGAPPQESVLFTTYTRALQTASRQLLEQILTKAECARVRVATCDELAREIVEHQRRLGPVESDVLKLFSLVRQSFLPSGPTTFERKLRARALAKIPDRYLLEEIEWIIEGREIGTAEAYEETPRPGRGIALGTRMRGVVWELYAAFRERLRMEGKETFTALRREALEALCSGRDPMRFDAVLVDEAQDLPPVALGLLANLARTPEGLFFAADSKQSIYSRGSGWTAADPRLQFRGRTATLQRNYRSTAEIDAAAFALLKAEPDEALEASTSPHSGPLPLLVRGVAPEKEAFWAARFLRQMARHLRMKLDASAVLVPDRTTGETLAAELVRNGVAAKFFEGRQLDLRSPEVKVLTFHSAKGLEFPTVVVAGLHPGSAPRRDAFEEDGAWQEALRHYRRLLYVACTRAMRGLMVIQPHGSEDPVLGALHDERWNVQEAS